MQWPDTFCFQGREIPYCRIHYNNPSERAVEVSLGFDFLINLKNKNNILEIGNVLSHYENLLSESLGIKPRTIIDKYEQEQGVKNIDLMTLSLEHKFSSIVSISTIEHIGQGMNPTLDYGETNDVRDLELPLKAIVKIYNLLEPNGQALLTIPSGKLMDLEWFIQASPEYLERLFSHYQIPRDAIEINFVKKKFMEFFNSSASHLPHQLWIQESDPTNLSYLEYNYPWPNANAIAVLKISKVTSDIQLDNDATPNSSLAYHSPQVEPISFDSQQIPILIETINKLREINLACFLDWHQEEQELYTILKDILQQILQHPDREKIALIFTLSNFDTDTASSLLSNTIFNICMEIDIETSTFPEIILLEPINHRHWFVVLNYLQYYIPLERENNLETEQEIKKILKPCNLLALKDRDTVQLETKE
ncbi:MAG: hypothetical protein AAGA60_24105 [Cyanobacteria bacterium P01_E01_bin.42]